MAKCFEHKWSRRDILAFIEEFAGIPREEILYEFVTGLRDVREEATESIALYLQDMVEGILCGRYPEEMEPVRVRKRVDGVSGKVRDIAILCIPHQLLNHIVVLMMAPLLKARIHPWQHASIPGRGQTRLKEQAKRFLYKKKLGIRCYRKMDVYHAYASLQYSVCIEFIEKECPKAYELITILKYLTSLAPGGHLIIGGFLDAWLFNFAMSYAIGYVLSLASIRRDRRIPYIIRCPSYMDDIGLFARTKTGLIKAVKALDAWMRKNLGLSLKPSTGIVFLLSSEEEKRRRTEKNARHGCSVFDMAGYEIARTHIKIRGKIFLRIRRQLLRAWREIEKTGTVRIIRAHKFLSYYGIIRQADSEGLIEKYHVDKILAICKRVVSYYGRLEHRKRMEEYNEIYRNREQRFSFSGYC